MPTCHYCAKTIPDGRRFCCDRHRAAWHRENVPHGTVTGIRRLKHGGWSITVRYPDLPPGLKIGATAWAETSDSTRTDDRHGHESSHDAVDHQPTTENAASKEKYHGHS